MGTAARQAFSRVRHPMAFASMLNLYELATVDINRQLCNLAYGMNVRIYSIGLRQVLDLRRGNHPGNPSPALRRWWRITKGD